MARKPALKKGLPVKGYVPQQQSNIDLANEGKILEEQVLRWIERVAAADGDPRCAALGKTATQEAFMWSVRGIFKPQRIKLPGDAD